MGQRSLPAASVRRPAQSQLTPVMVGIPPAVTVMALRPVCPSLVAVIVAPPPGRAGRGVPAPSLGVAGRPAVCPTWSDAAGGGTATGATGTAVTVVGVVPRVPSPLGVMVAEPAGGAKTRPDPLTVA